MYFRYTALNPDNKKLIGTIEASAEVEARNKLNAFGFSILELQTFTPETIKKEEAKGIERFAFKGKDEKERLVVGTIEALSDEEAYGKLREEYHIDIQELFPEGLPTEKQEEALSRLKNVQEAFEKNNMKNTETEKMKAENYQKERDELLKTVHQTIATVQTFLDEYGKNMKVEERDVVKNYVDQLLRIKDSTNLDHIRRTCELLLDYIQSQEIFLTEARRTKEQTTLKAETREYLKELKKTALQTEITFMPFFQRLSESAWFGPIGKFFLRITAADNPEMIQLQGEIKNLHRKILGYIRLYLFTKDENSRGEIRETITGLWHQKKRLKEALSALKAKLREERQEAERGESLRSWNTFSLLVGWLLAFYLIFYFIAFLFPKNFSFWNSAGLASLLGFLFLFHAIARLKRDFFPPRFFVNFLLYPMALVLYLLFLFNFVW